jgi:SAM-dependent methyltransferase
VSTTDERASYSFGDSPPAAVRLGHVARVFEPSTRDLLVRVAPRASRSVLDLGCGPGHTTRLLATHFVDAAVTGLDQSNAFLAEARRTAAPRTSFVEADVTTAPLPGAPADVVYARFVLSHLGDREAVLRRWFAALAPGGMLLVEEVDRIDTDDAVFAPYLAITTGLMASRGGSLYLGPELAAKARELGGTVRADDSVGVAPATADVATMFGLNLQAWRDDPWVVAGHDPRTLDDLAAGLRARRDAPGGGRIRWTLRQVAVARV